MLYLFRALFPQWNFFDQVAYTFELHFRSTESTGWSKITFEKSRKSLGILNNSIVNESLAQFNIVEHFARDIQELQKTHPTPSASDLEQLSTFKMLRSLLSLKINTFEFKRIDYITSAQFKIVATSAKEHIDIYVSDWTFLEAP